jgi:hypothetical protein
MSEDTEATPDAVADDTAAEEATSEAPTADEKPEAEAEAPPAEEVAPVEDPVADAVEESVAGIATEEEPAAAASARVAKVFFCDRGHRTTSLWSTPTNCRARPVKSAPECGRQLFEVGALPDQVVKALNPLKASKKAAKKG